MQHIVSGYRGLSVLFDLNWDRLIYVATIVVALLDRSTNLDSALTVFVRDLPRLSKSETLPF